MNFQAHTRNGFLTEIASRWRLVPSVAESWEASPDATVWTFNIRPGVQFHSGRTVTGADVIASLNHHRGEDSTSAAAPIVAQITEITADGD
jgi:peptide/nickel transport system substrate-binding protein